VKLPVPLAAERITFCPVAEVPQLTFPKARVVTLTEAVDGVVAEPVELPEFPEDEPPVVVPDEAPPDVVLAEELVPPVPVGVVLCEEQEQMAEMSAVAISMPTE
jgi:hypothetical protein